MNKGAAGNALVFIFSSLLVVVILRTAKRGNKKGSRKRSLQDQVDDFVPSIPIEHATTPPSSWYTNPSFLIHEKKTIFDKTWQPVARLDQLQKPGDYVSGEKQVQTTCISASKRTATHTYIHTQATRTHARTPHRVHHIYIDTHT